jgi:hypothetical protein
MKPLSRFALLIIFLLLAVTSVAAQATCPGIVNDALTYLNRACSRTGRNQVCYGNLTLVAQPQPGVTDLKFAAPGDIESITRIQSLTLSIMNEALPEWGVSLMTLQASLPGVLPGQNVTFLLFGSVQLNRDDATAAAAGYGNTMQAFTFSSGIGDAHCGEAPDSGLIVQTNRGNAEVAFTVNGVQVWLGSTAYIQSQPGGNLLIYIVEGKANVSAFGVSRIVPAGTFVSVPVGGDNRAVAPPSEPQGYNVGIVQRLAPMIDPLPRSVGLAPALDLSVCTLIPPANANTRQGPGTEFPRAARLGASVPQQAAGATIGSDGVRWFQLSAGNWVREDVINSFGPCAVLPDTSPQPTANPVAADEQWSVFTTVLENTCDPETIPVGPVGETFVILRFSPDRSTFVWDWGGGLLFTFSNVGGSSYVTQLSANEVWTVNFTSPTSFTGQFRGDHGGCLFVDERTGTRIN